MSCVKYLLFCFNLLFAVSGVNNFEKKVVESQSTWPRFQVLFDWIMCPHQNIIINLSYFFIIREKKTGVFPIRFYLRVIGLSRQVPTYILIAITCCTFAVNVVNVVEATASYFIQPASQQVQDKFLCGISFIYIWENKHNLTRYLPITINYLLMQNLNYTRYIIWP